MYDANSQPIIIQSLTTEQSDHSTTSSQKQQAPKLPRTSSVGSVVANALAVPGALKELIYPSSSESTTTTSSNTKVPDDRHLERHGTPCDVQPNAEENDSSSSEEEEKAMVDWLAEKRKSGMKIFYGFLAGGGGGSTATVYRVPDDDDHMDPDDLLLEDTASMESKRSFSTVHGEPIDDRTLANFQKYFVLPESEKLLAGKRGKKAFSHSFILIDTLFVCSLSLLST